MFAKLILAATTLAGCGVATHDVTPAPLAPCVGTVVTVHGEDPVGCDVTPPQRLDVTDVTVARCLDMGGEPITLTLGGPLTCEGVDY